MNANLYVNTLISIAKIPNKNNNDTRFEILILLCKLMCEAYGCDYVNKDNIASLLISVINSKEIVLKYYPDKIERLMYLDEFITKYGGV